jgi:hypothetical protein
MASLLIEARDAASAARLAGQSALGPAVLDDLGTRYRELAAAGLAGSLYRRTETAKDARRIARRFLSFEDLILRFATRPDLDIFPITRRSGQSGRLRSSSAAPEVPGGHSTGSPSSPSSSPTCPPPQMGHLHTRRPPQRVQRQPMAPTRPRTRRITRPSAPSGNRIWNWLTFRALDRRLGAWPSSCPAAGDGRSPAPVRIFVVTGGSWNPDGRVLKQEAG